MKEGKREEEERRGKGGMCGKATKGITREEAGASHKGKSTGRREEAEESRRGRSGVHGQATRSTARIEEELSRRAKEESRRALWKRHPRRGAIIRVRVDDRRNSSIVLDLQVKREGVSYRRQPGARSDPLLEVERIKLV